MPKTSSPVSPLLPIEPDVPSPERIARRSVEVRSVLVQALRELRWSEQLSFVEVMRNQLDDVAERVRTEPLR